MSSRSNSPEREWPVPNVIAAMVITRARRTLFMTIISLTENTAVTESNPSLGPRSHILTGFAIILTANRASDQFPYLK
jgi:hypothetical protein